jgi:hypothetical protein
VPAGVDQDDNAEVLGAKAGLLAGPTLEDYWAAGSSCPLEGSQPKPSPVYVRLLGISRPDGSNGLPGPWGGAPR